MKYIKFFGVLGACLLASATANASTVLTATDGDVNFVSFGSTLGQVDVYMFDDDYNGQTLNVTNGLLIPIPSIVGIAGPNGGGNWTATSETPAVITLMSAPDFIVALRVISDGSWIVDTGSEDLGANTQRLSFTRGQEQIIVDVATTVPVPAAVWLFGSGLLGLVGIARRRAV